MKAGIHPTFYSDTVVTCTCGQTFTTGSTKQSIHVDICWKCHPLWTGEQKFIDTLGQVGKFEQKMKAAQAYKSTLSDRKDRKDKLSQKPKSLKELLLDM